MFKIIKVLINNFRRSVIKKKNSKYKFIDLFAGIGGLRIAFENQGAQCVYSSENDKFAVKTYKANFNETPSGDITKINAKDIPDHDILLAGFPCTPFSNAGLKQGFLDKTSGTFFFDVVRITNEKRPKLIFLENIKNLMYHNKGNTFTVITQTLEALNYNLYYGIFNGKYFVPQHRERTIIIGFNKDYFAGKENYSIPNIPNETKHKLGDILEDTVDEKYTLSDKLWAYLQEYTKKHKAKGNRFGYTLTRLNEMTNGLSARYWKDGAEILIEQQGKNPRKLTPRECARLMGFKDSFQIPVSDTQAYIQFGNSVVVPMITYLAKSIMETLNRYKENSNV